MTQTLLTRHVISLPDLVRSSGDPYAKVSQQLFSDPSSDRIGQVYLTGCGDSYHAALAAALAFRQLAGLPCQSLTAMEFARYRAGYLDLERAGEILVIAISASGRVSRTVEALRLAREAGAQTVAVTGHPDSPLAGVAERIFSAAIPPGPGEENGAVVPGTRSYIASLLALYQMAVQIGLARAHLGKENAGRLREELAETADKIEETIVMTEDVTADAALSWREAGHFVFCGAGPNYGTALHGAAKVVEASGDDAIGQELEEWAHLEYFARRPDTPVFIISAAGWEEDRAVEIAAAARVIGRRVAVVAPPTSQLAQSRQEDFLLPFTARSRECFSPMLACIPLALFASNRAALLDEPYFRDFGGGRSRSRGGGISRIRTSHQIDRLRR